MNKRESQLPFTFNNDQDVKAFRDSLKKLSPENLKLISNSIDHETTRRSKPYFRNDTKEAMAGFLDKISFDYFCTFTTRKPVSLFATRRIAEKVCERVDAGHSSSVFWASEEFDVRDGFHFHALMKLPVMAPAVLGKTKIEYLPGQSFAKMDLFDWYFRKYGRCQIIDNREPDRQLAASYYISKYVTKRITDYDFRIAKNHMR